MSQHIISQYLNGQGGWLGEDLAREHFYLMGGTTFKGYKPIREFTDKKVMLYEIPRKLLGKDIPNYAQQIGSCFPKNALVDMHDGSRKAIQTILPGALVYTHLGNTKPVEKLHCRTYSGLLYTIKCFNQDAISCTHDHEFFTVRGWVRADQLHINDYISYPIKGVNYRVESISHATVDKIDVYCLSVKDDYSFLVNGAAVHNCVAHGMKNAIELLECLEILLNGDAETFKYVDTAYLYGCGRVFVGGGQIGGDGSVGSWQADAVQKYGVLFSTDHYKGKSDDELIQYLLDDADPQNNPNPNNTRSEVGKRERKWGNRPGPPKEFVELASKHLIKRADLVTSVDDAFQALASLSPITVASNQGFDMLPDRNGIHQPRGQWAHQMMIQGIDLNREVGIIRNSWGSDPHGQLYDFDDNSPLPLGCIRPPLRTIERMLSQGDSYAISMFDGYEDRTSILSKEDFYLGVRK
jgi:hypothetical protein